MLVPCVREHLINVLYCVNISVHIIRNPIQTMKTHWCHTIARFVVTYSKRHRKLFNTWLNTAMQIPYQIDNQLYVSLLLPFLCIESRQILTLEFNYKKKSIRLDLVSTNGGASWNQKNWNHFVNQKTQQLRNPRQSEHLANEMCPSKVIRITGNSIRSKEKETIALQSMQC